MRLMESGLFRNSCGVSMPMVLVRSTCHPLVHCLHYTEMRQGSCRTS